MIWYEKRQHTLSDPFRKYGAYIVVIPDVQLGNLAVDTCEWLGRVPVHTVRVKNPFLGGHG
jgi:hypothetical protein